MTLPSRRNERMFLKLVEEGLLKVTKAGIVTKVTTGKIYGDKKYRRYKFVIHRCPIRKKNIKFRIHRLVWLVFKGSIPDGYEPNHKNGNKGDNRLSNLELVTKKENQQHAIRIGLKVPDFGDSHGSTLYKSGEVDKIRKLFRKGTSVTALMKRFGFSRPHAQTLLTDKRRGSNPLSMEEYKELLTHQSGELNGQSKLTTVKVTRIFNLYRKGYTVQQISSEFGVTDLCIMHVLRGITWKHVPNRPEYTPQVGRRAKVA